ncbi:hypothetical protein H7K38_23505 [Mycobacterium alsense]|uniref:Uncharacterized protein n=1 Tax=Mycobacterium alsense TaxID=324058 RepID=A0AA41XVJ7_9MYCO|nr:hypothetical protein [Mycobacterium alsense]MCV7381585.1 hypothetical protein [Mycobacterium alsense]
MAKKPDIPGDVNRPMLWQLADRWEDRWRDYRGLSPLDRFIWKQAWQELVNVLGERFPKGKK